MENPWHWHKGPEAQPHRQNMLHVSIPAFRIFCLVADRGHPLDMTLHESGSNPENLHCWKHVARCMLTPNCGPQVGMSASSCCSPYSLVMGGFACLIQCVVVPKTDLVVCSLVSAHVQCYARLKKYSTQSGRGFYCLFQHGTVLQAGLVVCSLVPEHMLNVLHDTKSTAPDVPYTIGVGVLLRIRCHIVSLSHLTGLPQVLTLMALPWSGYMHGQEPWHAEPSADTL